MSETSVGNEASPTPTATPALAPLTPTATPTFQPVVSILSSELTSLPEGQLVFSEEVNDHIGIFVLKQDHSLTQVTSNTYSYFPVVSPDGRRIAFTSGDERSRFSIHLINVNGTGETALVEDAAGPMWASDGKQILFFVSGSEPAKLDRINLDGSGRSTIFTIHESVYLASLSPHGNWLLTTNLLGSNGYLVGEEMFLYNLMDGSHFRIQKDAEGVTWSPDGKKIAFAALSSPTNADIYVANFDGTGLNRLTSNPDEDRYPTWSPDGNYIAFLSTRDGNFGIFVMNSDGSHQVQLTNGFGTAPNWGPAPQ